MTLPEARDQQAEQEADASSDDCMAEACSSFKNGWDACLKELTKRIGEFDAREAKNKSKRIYDKQRSDVLSKVVFGPGNVIINRPSFLKGAKWQHAEILKLLRGDK